MGPRFILGVCTQAPFDWRLKIVIVLKILVIGMEWIRLLELGLDSFTRHVVAVLAYIHRWEFLLCVSCIADSKSLILLLVSKNFLERWSSRCKSFRYWLGMLILLLLLLLTHAYLSMDVFHIQVLWVIVVYSSATVYGLHYILHLRSIQLSQVHWRSSIALASYTGKHCGTERFFAAVTFTRAALSLEHTKILPRIFKLIVATCCSLLRR